jgi:integrase
MAAKLTKTGTPGVFRQHAKSCDRRGRCHCSYVIVFRDHHGRQRKETYRTLEAAREAKRTRDSQVRRGEFSSVERATLHSYAREWIERYQGTGRRGFREETRDEYRRLLEKYVLRYFPPSTLLGQVTPRDVADFLGWLVKQPSIRGGTLSDSSVHNAFKPLSACLATARREGLIRHNPATEATLPHRPRVEDDEDRARPFPRIEQDGEVFETMELAVALVHPDHRLLFELLAATGVRRSELLVFEGRHLALYGERPYVKVRQRVRRQKGRGLVIGALKSRYARRDLPIPTRLADRLRALGTPEDALVFPSKAGTVLDPDNLHERVLAPACEEAGVEWAGFHTFRHTVASRMFAAGRNVVQVQRWLGHHSPSFTLDSYVHLLDADLGDPLTPLQGNTRATDRPETATNAVTLVSAETAG